VTAGTEAGTVAVPPPPAAGPSQTPLAEEVLAGHPRLHLALGGSPDLAALIAPPLYEVVSRGIAGLDDFDREVAIRTDRARADVIEQARAALVRSCEDLRPVPVAVAVPAAEPDLAPEDRAQQDADASLERWGARPEATAVLDPLPAAGDEPGPA
jgi:hypothetical protein